MTNLRQRIDLNRVISKSKPKRRRLEHAFQERAIKHLELILPQDAILTSIDHSNSGFMSGVSRLRRGVLAGIPDVHIEWSPDPAAHLIVSVWMEAKTAHGRLSVDQEAWRDALLAIGAYWFQVQTEEEVEAALQTTPIPVRRVLLFQTGASLVTDVRR